MPNTYTNKVQVTRGGQTETLIDLTADTVTAADVAQGKTFHLPSGAPATGTGTGGGGVYQDQDGYLVLAEDGWEGVPTGNISITANGTYDVAAYAGASVDIPIGMTETELRRFIEHTLRSIEWPDGVTTIGTGAFWDCTTFNTESLPSTVTQILPRAFYGCRSLSLTSLPSNLTVLGEYAFYGCTQLALTSLPDGIEIIGGYCFYNCGNLALTSLSSNLETINSYAFCNCTGLSLTRIPSSVVSIYSNAFSGCSSLTSISCDGAITLFSSGIFNGNASHSMSLVSASFPNMAITSISTSFGSTTSAYACQQLEFCDIGSTTNIAASAFANCYKLQTLVLRKTASVCTLANVSAFLNTPMRGRDGLTGTVYVPSALIESYKTATNWSTLYNQGTVQFVAIEGSEYER